MNYRQLLNELQKLTEEQLNQDVCIWNTYYGYGQDEFYQQSVEFMFATEECQVLDVNHPIIRF